jgi:2'-5' RNA ligase
VYYRRLTDKSVIAAPLRLFFALWPVPLLRRQLQQLTAAVAAANTVRPVPANELHLTLAFVGHLPAGQLPLAESAGTAQRAEVASIDFDRLQQWGETTVLCADPRATPPELTALAEGLRDGLRARRVPVDARPYQPHVTLCRRARLPVNLPMVPVIRWQMQEFALIASRPRAAGSRYEVLRRWPCGQTRG